MNYTLNDRTGALSNDQREGLDTKLGLSLSRFASLVTDCNIVIEELKSETDSSRYKCSLVVNLQAAHEIKIEDQAANPQSSIEQAIQRTKRAIERHLRHHRGPRLGSSMTSRT